MRQGKTRLEFSEGSSNKFWEVEQTGAELSIRWGRIGTNGQTKEKSFADAAAAAKEAAKLIKAKAKKGYVEVSHAAPDAPSTEPPQHVSTPAPARARKAPAPKAATGRTEPSASPAAVGPLSAPVPVRNEDAWAIPDAWLRLLHPFRDGRFRATKLQLNSNKAWQAARKKLPSSRMAAARAYLSADTDAAKTRLAQRLCQTSMPEVLDPQIEAQVAACMAVIAVIGTPQDTLDLRASPSTATVGMLRLAEAWASVAPAETLVRIAVAALDVQVDAELNVGQASTRHLIFSFDACRILRASIVGAEPSAYETARDAARRLVDATSDQGRCLLAYLFPDETEFFESAVATLSHRHESSALLFAAARDEATLDRIPASAQTPFGWGVGNVGIVETLALEAGAAALPRLSEWAKWYEPETILATLAEIPSDAAVRILFERSDRSAARARSRVIEWAPRRASRCLGGLPKIDLAARAELEQLVRNTHRPCRRCVERWALRPVGSSTGC